MTTYEDNGYRYWYDTHLRMWTIHKIDAEGNQVGDAEYYTKEGLKINYPQLTFRKSINHPLLNNNKMTKQSALKQLETVIGKLSHLNYHIDGNALEDAIRATASVRDILQSGQVTVRS